MIRKLTLATFLAVFGLAFAAANAQTASAQATKSLPAEITRNMNLKKNKVYILEGGTFVRGGATLKIQAGTKIVGKPGSFLVIDKGAKILAKGKANKPVVFTSIQAPGNRRAGDWGGLIFNGNAPVNCAGAAGGTCEGEGGTGAYGGTDAADDQGELTYVRVEFGGFAISPDNELNCVAFQGTGSGLDVDHVEALYGGDDAFEWFGGTTNAKHLVAIGATDDNFDWTFGWSGKVQFAVAQQRADIPLTADPRGIEADNASTNFDVSPRSNPRMANVTLVGDPNGENIGSNQGIVLRRGTAGQLRNVIVMEFSQEGLQIKDDATYAQFASSALDLQGFIVYNNKGTANFDAPTKAALDGKGMATLHFLEQTNPQLTAPFNRNQPDFRPAIGSPALDASNVAPGFAGDAFFVDAPYVGAFNATDNWMTGWTTFVSN